MNTIKHAIVATLALVVMGCAQGAKNKEQEAPKTQKPNIVLFFVDDLGWNNLGYRNPDIFKTPNIDELAKTSMDFDQAYVANPACSPSRSTLVTGKHPARIGMFRHISEAKDKNADRMILDDQGRPAYHLWEGDPSRMPSINWLDLEHITYAEALKKHGYYNLFAGKWHLGSEEFHPKHQGFDQEIGVTDQGHPSGYYPDFFKTEDTFEDAKEGEYLTDRLTNEVIDFIDTYDKDQPFMISMWYYNVHSPNDGRKDLMHHFENNPKLKGKVLRNKKDALPEYASQVMAVDESIGRVRKALEAKGIDKNTVIIFTSDQGSLFEWEPYRGGKRVFTLGEGGDRVPFIISWPGVTKTGTVNRSVVQTTDIFPTLVEIAGGNPGDYPDLDGVSLLPTIKTATKLERGKPIFGYRSYKDLYASVREGDWKLLGYRSGHVELYNVEEDRVEANNLAEAHPEKVEALLEKLKAWEVDMNVAEYSGYK